MPDDTSEAIEGQFRPTSGEKVIIMMLCELFRQLGVDKDALELGVIEEGALGPHHWALRWGFPHIFEKTVGGEVADEVSKILDMWWDIEWSYTQLSAEVRACLEAEEHVSEHAVQFPGFDLNTEGDHYGAARIIMGVLGRFSSLKDREFNSHCPVLDRHRAMLDMYKSMEKPNAMGGPISLTADQISRLLKIR